jgi:hypothetical protein
MEILYEAKLSIGLAYRARERVLEGKAIGFYILQGRILYIPKAANTIAMEVYISLLEILKDHMETNAVFLYFC